MAAGPYAVAASTRPGSGTDAAAAFLAPARAVAAVHPVVALPYGDVDADSLEAAGLSDVVPRSLPGSPAGTAQDPPPAAGRRRRRRRPTDPATPPAEDRTATARRRRPHPRRRPRRRRRAPTSPGPPTGPCAPETLATLQAGGVDRLVLGSAGLTDGETAVGLSRRPRDGAHDGDDRRPGRSRPWWPTRRSASIVGTAEQSAGGARHGRAALPGRARRAQPRRRPPAASRPCWSPRPGTSTPGPRAPAP